jgi:phosphonoacetaldehyde reductase
MAVAVTLAPMLSYNAGVTDNDCTDPRGADHVLSRIDAIVRLLGAESIDEACSSILDLLGRIDCPVSLLEVGVTTQAELIEIVHSVNAERLSNNPRRASSDDLIRLLAPCITAVPGVNA